MLDLLSAGMVAWAALAASFTLITLWGCARLAARIAARPAPTAWPRIVVLRPCEGDEPGLRENLASSLARYDGARRVLLLVPDERDGSCAVARAVAAAAPPGAVEVVVTGVSGVRNRKSAQLAIGLRHALEPIPLPSHVLASSVSASEPIPLPLGEVDARSAAGEGVTQPGEGHPQKPEVIVQADSDVRLDDASLPSLIAALVDEPAVAAAFAVPVEPDGRTAGDFAASALLSCSHQDFFALAALTRLSGGVMALAGALAAHRTTELVLTGGFASLESTLGEDFEVGRRLAARGLSVGVSDRAVVCGDAGRSLREVIARTTRWSMVVRRQRGAALMASYPLLLAPTPLLLVASAVAALSGVVLPLLVSALLLCLRALLAARLRRIHRMPVGALRAFGLALAGESLMLAAFPRALFADEVVWRGRRLRILRGGGIAALAALVALTGCNQAPGPSPGDASAAVDATEAPPDLGRLADDLSIPLADLTSNRGCPPEMTRIDEFCVDRYEAYLVELRDGGEVLHSPFETVGGTRVAARAAAGVMPQGYVSQVEAAAACAAAGKRLCAAFEFARACRGSFDGDGDGDGDGGVDGGTAPWYPYGGTMRVPGACNEGKGSSVARFFGVDPQKWTYGNFNDPRLNQWDGGLAPTGSYPQCRSPYGVYDCVGNLHEWGSDAPDARNHGRFRGGFYGDAEVNGHGCLYVTSAHEPTYHDYSTGFRCCGEPRP